PDRAPLYSGALSPRNQSHREFVLTDRASDSWPAYCNKAALRPWPAIALLLRFLPARHYARQWRRQPLSDAHPTKEDAFRQTNLLWIPYSTARPYRVLADPLNKGLNSRSPRLVDG